MEIISIGIGFLIAGFIVAFIVACFAGSSSGPAPHYDTHLPDGEEYKDKVGTPERDHPSIAEQFDSRITNVFRNPWDGIL